MSVPTVVPRKRSYYLRTFLICLAVIAVLLAGFLFGVSMESSVYGTGVIKAKEQQTLRAPMTGLLQLGWLEGTVEYEGKTLHVRLDQEGNGISEPVQGYSQDLKNIKEGLVFHPLEENDLLWPGQSLAYLQEESNKTVGDSILVPRKHQLWQVLKIEAEPNSLVKAGDSLAMIVPIDPGTKEPLDLYAELTIKEQKFGEVQKNQAVRLYSNVFTRRLYGYAQATIKDVSPVAIELDKGEHGFHARARVIESPFRLHLGSTVEAQIVTGRKQVYRLILEN